MAVVVLLAATMCSAEAYVRLLVSVSGTLDNSPTGWTKFAASTRFAVVEATGVEVTADTLEAVGTVSIAANDVFPINGSAAAVTVTCSAAKTAAACVEMARAASYNGLRREGVVAAQLDMPAAPAKPPNGVDVAAAIILSLLTFIIAAVVATGVARHAAKKKARGIAFQELIKLEAEMFSAAERGPAPARHGNFEGDPNLL